MSAIASTGFEPLLEWIDERRRQPLDQTLKTAVAGRLLDYAASVAGGSRRSAVSMLAEEARRAPGRVPLPFGGTAAADGAMLPWGAAAHVLECDDTHQPSSTHPGAVVVTAALLAGAEEQSSLARVATATVIGYEVMCRLGTASGPSTEYERGFHPTGTCGVFGAAAAVSTLLDLDDDGLRSALGIAASFSSGSMAFLTNGAWTKLLHPGNAARCGLLAARLAARGYKGPADPLSEPHGYFAGHATGVVQLTAPLDEPLAVETTSVKAHGCCRYEQGPIDAILELREREGIEPADVARIRVAMLDAAWNIVAAPSDAKRRPLTVVDSQFSMPFGAALALVRGSASPLDHDEAALSEPAILRLAERVECYRDPALEADYPRLWKTAVEITLVDGTAHRAEVDHPKGDPENPFSLPELAERVAAFAPWAAGFAADLAPLCRGQDGSAADLVEKIAACFWPTDGEEGR